jgi:hypothetical protein
MWKKHAGFAMNILSIVLLALVLNNYNW